MLHMTLKCYMRFILPVIITLFSTSLYSFERNELVLLNAPTATSFIRGTDERVTYHIVDGLAIYGGDIILGEHKDIQKNGIAPWTVKSWSSSEDVQSGAPSTNTRLRWPNGILYYSFNSSYPSQYRQRVRDALKYVEGMTNVKFVEDSRQRNRVVVENGSGCWSYVGMLGGTQRLSLSTNGCVIRAIVGHEFMHALGIYHEQSRKDRDKYVTIHWNNIQSGMEGNFQKQSDTDTTATSYDYYSVMHYHAWAFAKNRNQPTISPKDPNIPLDDLGNYDGLTKSDAKTINWMYPSETNEKPKIEMKVSSAEIKKNQVYDLVVDFYDDGGVEKLKIGAQSDNLALLPDSNILIEKGDTPSQRLIVMAPAKDMTGVAKVTIRAADEQGEETSAVFKLTVKDNDPGPDKKYTMIVSALGACVTLEKSDDGKIFPVKPVYCQADKNQLWSVETNGFIRSKVDKEVCLQVSEVSRGQIVFAAKCVDDDNNRWAVEKEFIRNLANRDLVLDYYISSLKFGLWDFHGGNNQKWFFVKKEQLYSLPLLLPGVF
ncbi:ricin-type beta-trefoil lectin domain protein [Zooshikella marina]|uniref:M12 family metallopeptidase n=1 Tax=Zooshikella ganghwensis TaxID=202772 RepID=UPI001BAF19B8|nr:M12 family metallopeptidase [Zooshikella ganghwensis]MBU2705830.1 ricin-type beta-trefoil lectin domain protein [Zooshikella ganghwensis]